MKKQEISTKKGFKPETVRNIVHSLVTLKKDYQARLENGEHLKLVISSGNKKIGQCMNVSLAPIITCGNCKECKFFCYDVKACCQYENVRNARAKNTALFLFSRDEFFKQLWERMDRKKTNKFLRFHVSGEIIDIDHFSRMVETARRFPDFTIWTYTKMYGIVNSWLKENGSLPENFHVMFSEWIGLPIVNPYGMPVFRCVESEDEAPGIALCPGDCNVCKKHHCGCVAGQSRKVILH